MKKLLPFVLITVLLLILTAAAVQADTGPAVVINIRDGQCTVFNAGGVLVPADGARHLVETNSETGNSMGVCHAELPNDGAPDTAVHWNFGNTGAECKLQLPGGIQVTNNWRSVVTPGGNVMLICHFNPSAADYP